VEELYRIDARASHELAECVFVLAERCGDLDSLALAHRARALAAMASGSRKEALTQYEAAERLYRLRGDEVERARVLRSMMDPLMHVGRYEEALAASREAREVFERHRLPVLAAQVDANVGALLHRLDRNAESLEAYDRALAIFRGAGEEEAVAMMEFNRANVFSIQHELRNAGQGYRRALRYYRRSGFRLREAQCLHALAYLAYLGSRYSDALRLFERVRALDVDLGDLRHAALCHLHESEILLSLNAWEESARLGFEAQCALEELGMAYEAVKATLFRGLAAAQLRRFDSAAILLEEAARGFEREGNEVGRGLADLYRAELALRRDDCSGACLLARGAATLFGREGLPTKESYARVVAARALLRLGRRASARRQCHLALAGLRRAPSAAVAYRAHHLLGRLERDPMSAQRHLVRALTLVERLRAHVVPDELRASFQRDKVSIYEDYVRLLLSGADDPRLEEAFAIVEMSKARILGDFLARLPLEAEVAAPGRALGSADDLRRQLEELNSCYRRLNEAELAGRSRTEGEPLRREIQEREARMAPLFRSLQLGEPEGGRARRGHGGGSFANEPVGMTARGPRAETDPEASAGAVSPGSEPILLNRVQRLLASDEALVEFFFLRGSLHAFVIRPGGVRWLPDLASSGEIRERLERWRFLVEKGRLGREYIAVHEDALRIAIRRALEKLGDLVWQPLAGELADVRRLVLVPAGPLFYVPFHALRADGHFLVERFEISQAASARAYAAAHDLPRGRRAAPLVLGIDRPDLPAIEAEVAAVRRRLTGACVFVGPEARRATLRRYGNGARVIHIASHAVFRGDNPLLSAIELADGRLTFYDLFDMRLGSELVVLSGCQTGEHHVLEGDEILGLSRGFLYAGAASLLASLWPVDDAATARFMERFYARLEEGGGVRRALRNTMCELIGEGREPLEWAPFYLSGRPT
jgi:tetratricopeptide (TPR) repeat protein